MTITVNANNDDDTREPGSSWYDYAACKNHPEPDIFYSERDYPTAKRVCAKCPVRSECLDEGLRQDRSFSRGGLNGLWGGYTPDERLPFLRRGYVGK